MPKRHMNEHDYLLAWAAYGIAALGCLAVVFQLTGWMWRYLREPLRLVVAVLLLTPTIVDPSKELFAPAIAITALDLAFKVGNNVWKAVADLSMYGLIAFVVYLLFVLLRWPVERWLRNRRAAREAAVEDSRTLRERMEPEAERPRRESRVEPRL
jgi:signal transduction histidine kinase